jgi:hypothetical protein
LDGEGVTDVLDPWGTLAGAGAIGVVGVGVGFGGVGGVGDGGVGVGVGGGGGGGGGPPRRRGSPFVGGAGRLSRCGRSDCRCDGGRPPSLRLRGGARSRFHLLTQRGFLCLILRQRHISQLPGWTRDILEKECTNPNDLCLQSLRH